MSKSSLALPVVALLLFASAPGSSQPTEGRWSLSVLGGGNFWLSDASTQKLSLGGDMMLRYGFTPEFSLGVMAGYHILKTEQEPGIGLANGYYTAQTIPAALVGIFHLSPKSKFNPYLYIGAGAQLYRRKDFTGTPIANEGMQGGFLFPGGLGFDAFLTRTAAFSMNVGYRLIEDKVDLIQKDKINGVVTGEAGLTFFFGDSESEDEDKDGLTTAQERRLGTNPKAADTDGDGLSDGDEIRKYRTNPLRMDTDGDGLPDGDEIFKYRTDPTKFDTDGDGLGDGDELLKYKTDPLKTDTDGDVLSDGDEVLKYKTNPIRVDSDGDGLSDYDEIFAYKTDPNKTDTDGDGLMDGDEVKKYQTDPTRADTDRGGVDDGTEVKGGTDPLKPSDDKGGTIRLEKGKAVVLEGVTFASGSATLTPSSEDVLERALRALQASQEVIVEIAGYTDDVGGTLQNERLSLRRAEAVKAWLNRKGIAAWRMTTVGKGPREPIAPNDSVAGRAKNRRIEFHVK
jgi:outer membrane protein OmpA-like peptidoglycan-associated protein/outer membrane protein W